MLIHTILTLLSLTPPAVCSKPLRVDINPPQVFRSDIRTYDWENWNVSSDSPSRTFDGVTVTFSSPEALRGELFKANLVYGATMASDGISALDSLTMTITGLAPGKHSLVTYHNRLIDDPAGRYAVRTNGVLEVEALRPTTKVHADTDASCTYIEFHADGRPVVIDIQADPLGGPRDVVINGFEIDTSNPRRKAIKPSPAHGDEHVDADSGALTLAWTAPASAASHDVYFGTDRSAVATADRGSDLYRGNRGTMGETVDHLSHFKEYFWRVDEVAADGTITRGDVWRFQVRHLAFPGAEGYGRFARGGRGGRVIEVTNLEDSGAGSFRAAVEAEGPRTVVFRTSGVIRLKSPIDIKNPYLTIAGQTAPGDGICLRGYSVGTTAGSSDIIIRHIRIRVGDESGHPYNGTGVNGDHSIMDHCSISWSMDEGLSTRTARNVTFQRCLISEALHGSVHYAPHGFAASIGGHIASFHHNLLAHCAGRNWSLAGGFDNAVITAGFLDIRNNIVYNWCHRTTDGSAKLVQFVNNYYKPGPASKVFHIMKPDVGRPGDKLSYYIAGNTMEGRPEYSADNWTGVFPQAVTSPSQIPMKVAYSKAQGRKIPIRIAAPVSEVRSDEPFFPPFVNTTSAEDAYRDVLVDVGATRPRQDVIDRRIIEEVRTGTYTYRGSKLHLPGIIDSQRDLGPDPWPEYKTYDLPKDTDHDGMPDAWEVTHGLDPQSPPGDFSEANADPDGDGFTRLEDYLNELASKPLS